jgi:type 1 glutamine amidotransferase
MEETMGLAGKAGLLAIVGTLALFGFHSVASAQVGMPPSQRDPNATPRIPGQNVNGMRVYIRAGLKTHAPGEHDYPQFLADFSKILTEKGAVVDGSLHAPGAAELARTDVLVIYKGDAGYMTADEKAALEAFVHRGGGIVTLHDALCGPDPEYVAGILGGAKRHGEVNYTLMANVPYSITDPAHPIMQGMGNFSLRDEAFFNMTWTQAPGMKVLATTVIDNTPSAKGHAGEVVPQIWINEYSRPGGQPARSFVWMQGHTYANITDPQVLPMLLRGIAWAGRKPVNELVDYVPPPPPQRRPRSAAD